MRMMIVTGSVLLALLILTTGCSSDGRLADYAQRATEQQARQNEAMARQSEQVAQQSQELAQTTHKLVEQDAIARREMLQAHDQAQSQLEGQRIDLDKQRQELHTERQDAAQAAIREPVIAQALIVMGMILATLLPLIVAAYALRRLPDPSPSEALLSCEILEQVLSSESGLPQSEQPRALISDATAPRLPGPGPATAPNGAASEGPAA